MATDSKPYYVTLTGSKFNSGDYLIKFKAFNLFNKYRPDRKIIDFNGWEKINDEKLQIVNRSKALILLGGPALRGDIYPNVYPLRENLEDIKGPIIMLGIGYKDQQTLSDTTTNYFFTNKSLELLTKIENSGYYSGLRDFLSLNTLLHRGFKNFKFSGCPAMYEPNFIEKEQSFNKINKGSKIAFTTGRRYLTSKKFFNQQKQLIISLRNTFNQNEFIIAFHDPINDTNPQTRELLSILRKEKINYIDISSSAENLISFYNKVDLHIGYRVHAHIHMNSINKPSALICEDSRGIGIRTVLNGLIFNAYHFKKSNLFERILIKTKIRNIDDLVITSENLSKDIIVNIENEIIHDYPRLKASRELINFYFKEFRKILNHLP